jgi:GMC oxidoreductase
MDPQILSAPSFQDYIDSELSPGPQVDTDDEVVEFIRNTGGTNYQSVGTCKMGTDNWLWSTTSCACTAFSGCVSPTPRSCRPSPAEYPGAVVHDR